MAYQKMVFPRGAKAAHATGGGSQVSLSIIRNRLKPVVSTSSIGHSSTQACEGVKGGETLWRKLWRKGLSEASDTKGMGKFCSASITVKGTYGDDPVASVKTLCSSTSVLK